MSADNTTMPVEEAVASVAEAEADACAFVFEGGYDRTLHIAAIFIIMATSFLGTLLPILGKRFVSSENGKVIITLLKLFGAGVILATAFIHMFIPANGALTNECLPESFHSYEAFAAVFALAGIFFTHLIQTLAGEAIRKAQSAAANNNNDSHDHDHAATIEDGNAVQRADEPKSNEPKSSQLSLVKVSSDTVDHEGHTHGGVAMHTQEKHLMVYILELGIATHSIIIGITLGVESAEFTTLLVALTFHQFFEGMALSAVVMEANFKRWSMALGMVLFYTLTTPVGIAIGIMIHETFNANASSTLLSTGILDAISAGILAYDALVNIVAPHFSGKTYRGASAPYKTVQLLAMYVGCTAMAIIGKWA
ncbi:Zinc/iron permease [Entophlyctis helioformis]|nr:Zinc/iron permease [Entophlyctis helioformis]